MSTVNVPPCSTLPLNTKAPLCKPIVPVCEPVTFLPVQTIPLFAASIFFVCCAFTVNVANVTNDNAIVFKFLMFVKYLVIKLIQIIQILVF